MFFSRRYRLLYLALVGMEAGVYTPFVWILWGRAFGQPGPTPGLLWLGLAGSLLAMLLVVEVLGRSSLSDRAYRAILVLWVVVSGLMAVRILVYPQAGWGLAWLVDTGRALWALPVRMGPPAFILLLSFFLWWRAASLSSRERSFFSVALGFRLGLLLLIVGGTMMAWRAPERVPGAVQVLALYLFWGLLAVALARADDKAGHSSGVSPTLLPVGRLLQLLAIVAVTVGLVYAAGVGLPPEQLIAFLHRFDPLWAVLGWLLSWLVYGLAFLLAQVVRGLVFLLAPLFEGLDLSELLEQMQEQLQATAPQEEAPPSVQPWPYARFLFLALRVGFVGLVLALLVGGFLLFLARWRAEAEPPAQAEEAEVALPRSEEGVWQRLGRRLGAWSDLVRRYGVGRGLLAAISVENMYANLCRLARERGHPRRPWQPPDAYLPVLVRAFPGHEEALARITEAYMQVHYGDHPLDPAALAQLRADYAAIQAELGQ